MAKKARPAWDDGRVIAPMNVEGMPFYKEEKEKGSLSSGAAQAAPLTRGETGMMLFGAMKAALLVTAVFGAGIVGFVGLLLWVW